MFLVQMAQAWPASAQSRNLESKQLSEMKIIKIEIHVAQNVRKVWIGRKNNFPAPFGAIPGNFLHGPKTNPKMHRGLPIFLGGPMGPIHPVWGHVLVSYSFYVTLTWHKRAFKHFLQLFTKSESKAAYITYQTMQHRYLFPHPGWIAARAHQGK